MRFEHVLVVGAGQMGGGIAQVVAASGRRVSLLRRRARRGRARARGDAQEPRRSSPRRAAPTRTRCSARVDAGRRARPGRPDDRGGRRGRGREGGRLPPRRRDAARPRPILASNTSSIPIAHARRGDRAARPRDRHALLQPGAGAEARRGRARPARPPTRRPRRSSSSRASSARRRRSRTTSPASSRTGS